MMDLNKLNEARLFLLGLEQCREKGGMEWSGEIPEYVEKLYGIDTKLARYGVNISGVYVTRVARYKPFKPDWDTKLIKGSIK